MVIIAILAIVFFVAAAVFAFKYYSLKSKIVELSDVAPAYLSRCNMVLKLQNELKPFVKLHNGKVVIKVVKPK